METDKCTARIIHIEKVKVARETSLPDVELDNLAVFYKTFADKSRLRMLMALADQEMCVCDLAALLGISESGVSHQLRYLRTIGFVRNRREGTVLYYRLTCEHVSDVITIGLAHLHENGKMREEVEE